MPTTELTVGIEEEFQIVSPETGALEGRAPELVAASGGDVKAELQRTMVEVATPICADVAEVVRRVSERRRLLASFAAERGLAIAAAGLHPAGALPASQLTDDPHYWRLAARGGIVAKELHIFGMHLHVAVPSREAAVSAMCGAATYIPHLLALTASSPFHRAQDTEFASFRTILRDMFPRVGPPLPVESAAEYDELLRTLGGRESTGGVISWDIRPSAQYPTLEFRFFDVTPRLEVVAVVAALARALTALFIDRPAPAVSATTMQLLRENRWRAARFGLGARFYRTDVPVGEERPAADAIRALAERLAPTVQSLGDGASLDRLDGILTAEGTVDAMRRVRAEQGSFTAVTRWVVDETLKSLA